MLELKALVKKYEIGTFKQTALNGVNLSFRDQEFVCITGPSGSGKTTLLNMIGGLDRYDAGDLLINDKSTRHFSDTEWDSYRNHAIGFVFQNYNLITHTSVLANVEIGMTLSGLSTQARRDRAIEVLDRVGLKDHIYKKPNQLSGGQQQRVAIARALANDPDIILADEPTGAIDSETSRQIMSLIQEIAKDKLVIMVTHDESIAETYSDRIVALRDGKIVSDTNPIEANGIGTTKLKFKKTAMAFAQALKLSFNNLRTKKFRTAITAFAGSIGIIGIALVLSLANGLNNEIDRLERTTLAEFPIQVEPTAFDLDAARRGTPLERVDDVWDKFPDIDEIFVYEPTFSPFQHTNILTEDYLDHVKKLDSSLVNEITVIDSMEMHIMHEVDATPIMLNQARVNFGPMLGQTDFFEANYDMLAGSIPQDHTEMLLVVDEYNRLTLRIMQTFGLNGSVDSVPFDAFLEKTFQVFDHDSFYIRDFDEDNNPVFSVPNESNRATLFNSDDGIDLTISGIARLSDDALGSFLSPGLKYHPSLVDTMREKAQESLYAEAQLNSPDENILTGNSLSESEFETLLARRGITSRPRQISIYPVNFDAKADIREHLDAYNEDKDDTTRILYTDFAEIVTELTGDVIDGITYVLIAFSAISLVVSSIMIGIITYISVLERTKEIGILRSLGARKRDISRVFNAETTIIGFTAGIFGIVIAYGLTFPINAIIRRLVSDIGRLAVVPLWSVFALIVISVILTFISGLIPARIASKKNPVEALRVD